MTHVPVLTREVIDFLQPGGGGVFVDCTVGLGGHARALLVAGASKLIGLDRDASALVHAASALMEWGDRVELVHADYRDLASVLDARGLSPLSGVIADLGVSSMQLETPGRGFSFQRDEPLDMRMDTTRGETAAVLLSRVAEADLADVIFQFGEERHSRRIARALVRARERAPLTTTGQVADIVRHAQRHKGWSRIDPATRTFQALRIWVNRELDGLDGFLRTAAARLVAGGRFAVISFHSLEDRIVKHTFRNLSFGKALLPDLPDLGVPLRSKKADVAMPEEFRVVTKRPVTAGDEEVSDNPRARSAKLRVLERIA